MQLSFIEKCLSGDAMLDEIDQHVEDWHNEKGGIEQELHEYLGMNWEEYSQWGTKPSILPYIVSARKNSISLDEELRMASQSLAARAGNESEAQYMLSWLTKRGKI